MFIIMRTVAVYFEIKCRNLQVSVKLNEKLTNQTNYRLNTNKNVNVSPPV